MGCGPVVMMVHTDDVIGVIGCTIHHPTHHSLNHTFAQVISKSPSRLYLCV